MIGRLNSAQPYAVGLFLRHGPAYAKRSSAQKSSAERTPVAA
jgi:hypothetical protein